MANRSRGNRSARAQHLTGPYREDAPPPVNREPRQRRVRRPGCILAAGLLLAVVSAAVVTLVLLLIFLRPRVPEARNAIWLGIDWGQDVHTDEAVENLANLLRSEGIGTAYVWLSWLQEDLTWSDTTFENMPAFVAQIRHFYPELRLDAWIGLPTELPDYRLGEADVRDGVNAIVQRALTEFAFDGIHLNAEPVWSGDEDFITLLRGVRQSIGPEAWLSVSVPPDWNTGIPGIPAGPLTTPEAYWSAEYKQRVAFLANELTVMAYSSGLSTTQDYETWMAFQVTRFVEALVPVKDLGTRLVIGIPTYDAEPPGHDPAVENVQTAVAGIKRGIDASGENGALVYGVAIYANWTTDANEWAAYRQLWLLPDTN